jgi:mRNA interferase YafQ
MKYQVKYSSQFKKDLKSFAHKSKILEELQQVIKTIMNGEQLPVRYLDHNLKGKMLGKRECHIKPDILLVYEIIDDDLILLLLRL